MTRALSYAAIGVVLSMLWAPWATAADLSANYLYGRWVIDEQKCSSPDSEYIEFNKNGTFKGTRAGKAEFVGFWGLKDGIVVLHMLTSPAFFKDLYPQLAGFEGVYDYLKARMALFNIRQKSFETVGIMGDQFKKASAVRCP